MTPYAMLRANVVQEARRCIGLGPECCADAAQGYDLLVVEWCQIFWLHCVREADLTERTWADLARANTRERWVSGWLEMTSAPLQGDMGYIEEPNDHGAVFDRADGAWVYTIDGNAEGGIVRGKRRRRSEFTAWFSIQELVESYVPPEYRYR